jgi:hypothetical protein
LLKDIFHMEVIPTAETRDLVIKRTAAGTQDANSGFLVVDGSDRQVPVVYQGQLQHLPAKFTLPAGKYEVRSILDGKVVGTQDVEISATGSQTITVKR